MPPLPGRDSAGHRSGGCPDGRYPVPAAGKSVSGPRKRPGCSHLRHWRQGFPAAARLLDRIPQYFEGSAGGSRYLPDGLVACRFRSGPALNCPAFSGFCWQRTAPPPDFSPGFPGLHPPVVWKDSAAPPGSGAEASCSCRDAGPRLRHSPGHLLLWTYRGEKRN